MKDSYKNFILTSYIVSIWMIKKWNSLQMLTPTKLSFGFRLDWILLWLVGWLVGWLGFMAYQPL